MFAVIKIGGKQYLVSPGDKIKIEKIAEKEGEETIFNEVLLFEKNKKLEIGTPIVRGAKISAKILKQGKGKKVIIFKHRPKKHYKVKKGHRQSLTQIEITKIITG